MFLRWAEISEVWVLTPRRGEASLELAASELCRGLRRLNPGLVPRRANLPGPDTTRGQLRFVLLTAGGEGEGYEIRLRDGERWEVTVDGQGKAGVLYGVLELLERQGAFFGLDGDLYPLDLSEGLDLPDVRSPWRGTPRFAVRGLMPWPDFLNCVTVFNDEDWRSYLEAMVRMRFNTLGIHVYGQANKWAESFLTFEYGGVGYTAYTDTTATDRWGYLPQRTSRYGMGASQYYDEEVFGSDATRHARGPWEAAEMARDLWRRAFAYAERLGIRTGVGFEPYQLPDEILRATPPEVRRDLHLQLPWGHQALSYVDPESRTARRILEARLDALLESYPAISYVWMWEDESMSWASHQGHVPLSATPFLQAHDYLRRHAPDKRLVICGWGGVVRHFDAFHRLMPEDVIFAALNDQLGWDPVHEAFARLGDRERWAIPWLEDDASMWLPQLHVGRLRRDVELAGAYGCQGLLGLHWRHRIIDPNANYLARSCWGSPPEPERHYILYACTQAHGERARKLGQILLSADREHRLLSTWTGVVGEDGHHVTREPAGDYSEAFRPDSMDEIPSELLDSQAEVCRLVSELLSEASGPVERERLGYWEAHLRFLDRYARALRVARELQGIIRSHADRPETVSRQGLERWRQLLRLVREAVLPFQRALATRHDLGTLASIQNKLVRIACWRLGESLREVLGDLPPDVERCRDDCLAPDPDLEAQLVVPTRPTRASPGEVVKVSAIAAGTREPVEVRLRWRRVGEESWCEQRLHHVSRRTFAGQLQVPWDAEAGLEYVLEGAFAGYPEPLTLRVPGDGCYMLST